MAKENVKNHPGRHPKLNFFILKEIRVLLLYKKFNMTGLSFISSNNHNNTFIHTCFLSAADGCGGSLCSRQKNLYTVEKVKTHSGKMRGEKA